MVETLQNRSRLEESWQEEYQRAIDDLAGVDNRRILQNHALVLAWHRLFCRIHKIRHDLADFMRETAIKKTESAAAQTYTAAHHFFETIDLLDGEKLKTCIHVDEKTKLLYINLPAVEQLIRNKGANFSYHDNLSKALTEHPAYVKNSFRFRFPGDPEIDSDGRPRQRRCWIFDCNKLG
jgi:hypothetical protein